MEYCGVFPSSNNEGKGYAGNQRNDTQVSEGRNSTVVISVVENRAREICICKVDTQNVSWFERSTCKIC